MTKLNDYKDRCGTCEYWTASYKNGRMIKMGRCHKGLNLVNHRASDKKCLQYAEKGGANGSTVSCESDHF